MVYATKKDWAIRHNYATWAAYETARPGAPSETHINEMLEEMTEIINFEIGSFNSDVTDSRFASFLQKLCLRMTDRAFQVDLGQGTANNIPMFSPNDFLIERERAKIRSIGKILGYRSAGKVIK